MEQVVIINNFDGSCSIIHPSPKEISKYGLDRIENRLEAQNLKYTIADKGSLPKDREFRNAWTYSNSKLEIDLPKAKEIHMSRIRKARNEMLKGLDQDFMIASEDVDTTLKNKIVAKKKQLRDLPENVNFSNVTTIKKLKAFWPEELKVEK